MRHAIRSKKRCSLWRRGGDWRAAEMRMGHHPNPGAKQLIPTTAQRVETEPRPQRGFHRRREVLVTPKRTESRGKVSVGAVYLGKRATQPSTMTRTSGRLRTRLGPTAPIGGAITNHLRRATGEKYGSKWAGDPGFPDAVAEFPLDHSSKSRRRRASRAGTAPKQGADAF